MAISAQRTLKYAENAEKTNQKFGTFCAKQRACVRSISRLFFRRRRRNLTLFIMLAAAKFSSDHADCPAVSEDALRQRTSCTSGDWTSRCPVVSQPQKISATSVVVEKQQRTLEPIRKI
jgi:hypothetical protein